MPKAGPRKIYRYSDEFKAQAVRLSALPGVEVQEVAHALAIHPFMLSRWRKQAREGESVATGKSSDPRIQAQLKELATLKRKYKMLQEEHDALKKFIEWKAKQKQTPLPPSTPPKPKKKP